MNVIKEYKINNRKKGQVTFGSKHGGMWLFEVSDRKNKWTRSMKVPGGLPVAEKIADAICLSWLRTADKTVGDAERIDWITRRKIDLLAKVRTLKDYKDEPEFWTNAVPTEGNEAVRMDFVNRPKGISAEDIATEHLENAENIIHDLELISTALEAVAS